MKLKLKLLDPIREAIMQGWKVDIHTDDRAHLEVTVLSMSAAYIVFEDDDDSSGDSWVALPWHRVASVQYVSPQWVDAKK